MPPKLKFVSLPLPQLRHFFGAFVERGDDFGVGEGAGVDADFVVGRGDETAEDERRGLLIRELARALAKACVVLIELEKHSLARFFTSQGVEMRLTIDKALAMTYGLHFAKGAGQGHPLCPPTPSPENAVFVAVRRRRYLEDEIAFGAKPLVRRRRPDLNRERHKGDRTCRELEGRAGTEHNSAVFNSGVVGLRRRDVADGIGKAVGERPAMN